MIVEINADERIAALIVFDVEDFDAAIAELDARYVAGEAAADTHTWSVISSVFAALRRRELPSTTTDFVDIDHRKGTAFAPGELMEYLRAGWEINQEVRPYVEAVHRLNSLGAVVTHSAQLTSREGFEAEWRTIDIMTVDGDLINRCELFDEADLDAALARFEELSRGAATGKRGKPSDRTLCGALRRPATGTPWRRCWPTTSAVTIAVGVVSAGIQHGRDADMANMRTVVDLWITNVTSTIIATRGERLVLMRTHFSGSDQGPEAFLTDVLGLVEIDADERIVGDRVIRPRRLRRRLRRTRRTLPRRRSRRPRAHVVRYRTGLTPRSIGANCPPRQRTAISDRPPAGGSFRARRA